MGTRRPKLNEEQTKISFVIPFFQALGWEMLDANVAQWEVPAGGGRVDASLLVEGVPRVLVEVKGLEHVIDEKTDGMQAVQYAYNKGIAWAILTNFADIYIFNAERLSRDPRNDLFRHIPCEEFEARWDELTVLSPESFEAARLDDEAERLVKRPRRLPVGKKLFDDLLVWRDDFMRSIRTNNSGLDSRLVAEGVQHLLDRLMFIRTAEDRRLESSKLLEALRETRARNTALRPAVERIFREYDRLYDSPLFAANHAVDSWKIDDTAFVRALAGLYEPHPGDYVRYDFRAINADVLGGIYEQYLDQVQGARDRRHEEGIYYTAPMVTHYIAAQTIGHRIADLGGPDGARDLAVLDPACGSGSFLVAAIEEAQALVYEPTSDPHEYAAQRLGLIGAEHHWDRPR